MFINGTNRINVTGAVEIYCVYLHVCVGAEEDYFQ